MHLLTAVLLVGNGELNYCNCYFAYSLLAQKCINDAIAVAVAFLKTSLIKSFNPSSPPKPTGQGTCLGLSLAYDIITKEHNGTIKVESKEGEGSVFTINL